MDENQFQKIIKLFKKMKEDFEDIEPLYRQIRKYMLPYRGRFKGDEKDIAMDYKSIIGNTVNKAAELVGGGLCAGLTPRNKMWFEFDKQGFESDSATVLDKWGRYIFLYLKNSNFYSQLPDFYADWMVFGLAAMGIFWRDDQVKCLLFNPGSYYVERDMYNEITAFATTYTLSAHEIIDEYKFKNISADIKIEKDKDKKKFDVVNLITKSEGKDKKREWSSYYFLEKGTDKEFLDVQYYDFFPIVCVQNKIHNKKSGYGVGAGYLGMGDVKMLVKLIKTQLLAIQKIVSPPVQIIGAEPYEQINLGMNGITYIRGTGANVGIKNAYSIQFDATAVQMVIQQVKQDIMSAFKADLFLQITSESKQMTATEVNTLTAEQRLQFSAIFDKLTTQFCKPVIDLIFNYLWRRGILPEPTDELEGVDLEINYNTLLGNLDNQQKLSDIQKDIAFATQVLKVKPDIVKLYDFEELLRTYHDLTNAPSSYIHTHRYVEEMEQIEAQQQQQAQQQQMMAQAMSAIPATQKQQGGQGGEGAGQGELL